MVLLKPTKPNTKPRKLVNPPKAISLGPARARVGRDPRGCLRGDPSSVSYRALVFSYFFLKGSSSIYRLPFESPFGEKWSRASSLIPETNGYGVIRVCRSLASDGLWVYPRTKACLPAFRFDLVVNAM